MPSCNFFLFFFYLNLKIRCIYKLRLKICLRNLKINLQMNELVITFNYKNI